APAATLHADLALKMTLLADRYAKRCFEAPRIDDGLIRRDRVPGLGLPANVHLTGAVAALAADRAAARKDRRAEAIDGRIDRVGVVGVTEDALRGDRSVVFALRLAGLIRG